MRNPHILKELRQQAGYTQQQVADKMFICINTVKNWERRPSFRYVEDLHKLLSLYGVPDDEQAEIILMIYGKD